MPKVAGSPVIFSTADISLAPELTLGGVYPWLDGRLLQYHLDMILGSPSRWRRRAFTNSARQGFRPNGAIECQPVGPVFPDGVVNLDLHRDTGGHASCELCLAHTGVRGTAAGFVDPDEQWLCAECHSRYATKRNVSFAAEEQDVAVMASIPFQSRFTGEIAP